MNSDTTSIQHLLRHKALLQVEYNEEKQAFTLQAETVPVERKVKRGNAWWPLRLGGSGYNSLNQLTIEVHRTSGDDIDHHFEPGTPVRFFTCPPSAPVSPMMQMMAEGLAGNAPNGSATPHSKSLWRGRWLTTGTVSYVDGGRMVVALPAGADTAQLLAAGDVGVQVFFDETSYRLMFDALSRAINARGNRLAYLRDLFAGSQPARTFTFGDIHLPWLNSTQTEAVNKVLRAKDVAIVHGPPGTGKTTTLVEAIHETLHRESQVLVAHRATWQ